MNTLTFVRSTIDSLRLRLDEASSFLGMPPAYRAGYDDALAHISKALESLQPDRLYTLHVSDGRPSGALTIILTPHADVQRDQPLPPLPGPDALPAPVPPDR